MSLLVNDERNKYILTFDTVSDYLDVSRYDLSTWNPTSKEYNTEFQWKKTIGGPSSVCYWGSFSDTTTQTNAGATYANVFTYNTTELSKGIYITESSKITFESSGIYNLQFSAQFDKTDSGADEIEVWLSRNGVNVGRTATFLTLDGNNAKLVAAWNFFIEVEEGDYYELKWHSNDLNMRLFYREAQSNPDRPQIPSIILTVHSLEKTYPE